MTSHSINRNVIYSGFYLRVLQRPVPDFANRNLYAPQTGRFCSLQRHVWARISPTTCPTATYNTSKERKEACHTCREKITTQMHRVAARHEFPFRPSNRPKRTGFQTSHPSTCHGEARDTRGRGRACPPRERASKTRKSHAPFVWKASRGGTRGPGTHLPKKWHKGVGSSSSFSNQVFEGDLPRGTFSNGGLTRGTQKFWRCVFPTL